MGKVRTVRDWWQLYFEHWQCSSQSVTALLHKENLSFPSNNILREIHCVCVWYHFVHDIYFCTLKGHVAISVAITSGSAGGHSDNTNTQSAHSIQSQMETTHQSRPVMKPVHSLLLLCVFQWGDVMYGDCSGSTGDAELLYAVFFHAVQLSPGELEAVFWGWVWVDNAAWHRGDAHMTQWHAASTCGLRHLLTSFGTTTGSQDPGDVCPPGNIKNMMFPQVLP